MKVKVQILGNSYERTSKTGTKYHAGSGVFTDPESRFGTTRVFVVSDAPFTGNREVSATLTKYDGFKGEASCRI